MLTEKAAAPELLPTSYHPGRGFIGSTQVDVANYLFSVHPAGGYRAHPHASPITDKILGWSPRTHYQIGRTLTEFLKYRDLTFSKTTPRGGYKIFNVPVTSTILPITKSMFNRIEIAAQSLTVSLRKVLQSIYGAPSVEESDFVQSLPEDVRKIFVRAITSSAQYIEALHHPVMKDYPFFDIVGLDLVLVEDYLKHAPHIPRLLTENRLSELPELPFRILELNAGSPSGAANNTHLMRAIAEHAPELFDGIDKVMPNDHFDVLYKTYQSLGDAWTGQKSGIPILLPPGGANGAAPEIHQLSAFSGIPYVDPNHLYLDEQGYLRVRTITGADSLVTSVYSRVNSDAVLFNPEKGITLRDPESGEPLYVEDSVLSGSANKNKRKHYVLNEKGERILSDSCYAIPNALELIHSRKLYLGGLNRVLDNKIILATLTHYAPQFYADDLKKLGLDNEGDRILPPETLPPEASSVEQIRKNPNDWVIKAPDLSGGKGVSILQSLGPEEQEEILREAEKDPTSYAYQRLVKIARIPVAIREKSGFRYANLAADLRLWVFYGAGPEFTKPKLTHNGLVRFAPEEKGENSSIVNTSMGGGYAPLIVVDDTDHAESVTIPELIKRVEEPLPVNIDAPIFVSAQLVQVAYILREIENKARLNQTAPVYLLKCAYALKSQCREILSYLSPDNMEALIELIEFLEKRAGFAKPNTTFYEKTELPFATLKARLIEILHDKNLPDATRAALEELGFLKLSVMEILALPNSEFKQGASAMDSVAATLKNHADSRSQEAGALLCATLESITLHQRALSTAEVSFILKSLLRFRQSLKARLSSNQSPSYLNIFEHAWSSPAPVYDLWKEIRDEADSVGTLWEHATGLNLVTSDLIPVHLREARAAWLDIEAQVQSLPERDRARFLEIKRNEHFKRFSFLKEYQALIDKTDPSIDDIVKVFDIAPYAKFNVESFAKSQGVSVRGLFVREPVPSRIAVLDENYRREHGLYSPFTAGECFARKPKRTSLFHESDICLWVSKELSPFSMAYTIGHELIHYHQINTIRIAERDAMNSPEKWAYFLNEYANFLTHSARVMDHSAADSYSDRICLYGLGDLLPFKKTLDVLQKLAQNYKLSKKKSVNTFDDQVREYGSLWGILFASSPSAKVKALREAIPALENAKNILFAKQLGLNVPYDEVQAALPTANAAQTARSRKNADIEREALETIAHHQLFGVGMSQLQISVQMDAIQLGQNYNSMQQ